MFQFAITIFRYEFAKEIFAKRFEMLKVTVFQSWFLQGHSIIRSYLSIFVQRVNFGHQSITVIRSLLLGRDQIIMFAVFTKRE